MLELARLRTEIHYSKVLRSNVSPGIPLMPKRSIKIELVKAADGRDRAELDLIELGKPKDWPWLLRELAALSDADLLLRFLDSGIPPGAEGTWGFLSLPPYLVMCQLATDASTLWTLGIGGGVLKVVRVAHQSESELIRSYLAAAAQNDDVNYE
jgi:hypothetical protein